MASDSRHIFLMTRDACRGSGFTCVELVARLVTSSDKKAGEKGCSEKWFHIVANS